jgi:hypothetical protein
MVSIGNHLRSFVHSFYVFKNSSFTFNLKYLLTSTGAMYKGNQYANSKKEIYLELN